MKLQTLKPRVQMLAPTVKVAAVVNPSSWRTENQTSTQRGYGYKWQQARAGYLAKHPLCVYCEREGRCTAATVVDHRIPHRGDMKLFWDSSLWQSLCAHCHSSTKQREEAATGLNGRAG